MVEGENGEAVHESDPPNWLICNDIEWGLRRLGCGLGRGRLGSGCWRVGLDGRGRCGLGKAEAETPVPQPNANAGRVGGSHGSRAMRTNFPVRCCPLEL